MLIARELGVSSSYSIRLMKELSSDASLAKEIRLTSLKH